MYLRGFGRGNGTCAIGAGCSTFECAGAGTGAGATTQPGANRIDLDAMTAIATPLGHKGFPDDIAQGVLYLASEEARYVTGSELVIDGGFAAR